VRSVNRDITAEARIRDAALERFPRDGFEATTIRSVADQAGVSPGLVIHHYESKEGLRRACDAYVIQQIRAKKEEAIKSDHFDDSETMSNHFQVAGPLMRYLGWALSSGSDAAGDLFDEMVNESTRLTELAVEAGAIDPSPDPRARAAVLLSMQVGSLLLGDHVGRALGEDIHSVEGVMRVSRASLEIFTGAMFPPGRGESMLKALETAIENTRRSVTDG
jgi:TetR/AcrR family transcriptional regulator, regulator of cefoperazone and chloramphenicol sensitivity